LGVGPGSGEIANEDLLTLTDVVPEALHVTQLDLDGVDVLVATIDKVGVLELLGGEAVVRGLLLIDSDF
jgi:hypothetical protein